MIILDKHMKNYTKIVAIFLVVIVLIIVIFYWQKNNEDVIQNKGGSLLSQDENVIKNLAEKYGAKTYLEDWDYTFQVQQQLSEAPILFKGYVEDIFKYGEIMFVKFESPRISKNVFVLELECNQQTINKILEHDTNDGYFDEYAMVANIQEVSKPSFALKGSALSEDEVEINLDSSSYFTAKGNCIDVAFIGK